MNNSDLISTLEQLLSEDQNPDTIDIDLLSSLEVVTKINQQDQKVAKAVEKILPHIADAVDCIIESFNQNGRLIYLGAGTSGRIGVLDAVECVPTFGVDSNQVMALMAGGNDAMFKAKEGIEDDPNAAIAELKNINLNHLDVVVGIAASGRTPYVIGALKYAATVGAKTIALSCNPEAEIASYAQIALLPIVGAEALTGSTRMKSGTAQKMVLNMLSTASMIGIGKSYKNLMVDVRASNKKLMARGIRMIMQVTGVKESEAKSTLLQANLEVKLAIMMLLTQTSKEQASRLIDNANGFLRKAIETFQKNN